MVATPRATRKFAEAQMQRSKTDQVDAQGICDFARRMEFRPWQSPEQDALELRDIGENGAVLLLPELIILPEEMTVRQWVDHTGLDPRNHQSGDSVENRERVSKGGNVRLRCALYMPALVAIQWEPNVGAFYEKLLPRGKKPIVAVVAVMRKLLHSIYGMLKYG